MENNQDHLHKAFHDNRLLVKVPQVTAFFWIIKILCTTVGETFADFLNTTLGFGLNGTTVVTVVALAKEDYKTLEKSPKTHFRENLRKPGHC